MSEAEPHWADIAISWVLRGGVLISVGIIALGAVLTFAHHPDYFRSRPELGTLTAAGAHFPNSIPEVVAGVSAMHGQAIMMAGLLLLIATPVARVALSIAIFVIEHDRLYTAITTAVLVILLIAFALGRAGE
jgi:uncharacterized membrane protein